VRQASALACEGSVCHPKIRKKEERKKAMPIFRWGPFNEGIKCRGV